MPLQRIEMNVMTGESKVLDLTLQEEADAWARTAEENAKPIVKQETVADLTAALIAKGVLTASDVDAAVK